MKVDVWMPFYVADYLIDTTHLTTEQHGIYLLLMIHQWKKGFIPNNKSQILLITKTGRRKWYAVEQLLDEFFELLPNENTGKYVQHRLEKEKAKAESRSSSASKNGKKGGRPITDSFRTPKAVVNPTLNRNYNRTESSSHSHTQKEKKTLQKIGEYSEEFMRFWVAYPKKEKKRPTYDRYLLLRKDPGFPPVEELIASINRSKRSQKWHDGYIPMPITWLNQNCWEDELDAYVHEITAEDIAKATPEIYWYRCPCGYEQRTIGPRETCPKCGDFEWAKKWGMKYPDYLEEVVRDNGINEAITAAM